MIDSNLLDVGSLDSPVGALTVAARGERLCLLHFGSEEAHVRNWISRWYPGAAVRRSADPAGIATALARYFDGDLDCLDAIPVELNGTPFQKRVWERLRGVRAGTTASYSQIARDIRASHAVRAVGAANGANPVAIVVPCHRIIGANGSLTGYGGGLDRKRWLLEHEGAFAAAALF